LGDKRTRSSQLQRRKNSATTFLESQSETEGERGREAEEERGESPHSYAPTATLSTRESGRRGLWDWDSNPKLCGKHNWESSCRDESQAFSHSFTLSLSSWKQERQAGLKSVGGKENQGE
jgi:hypothetical protein